MLQRNLLYTGVTRGKKLVVLVGSRKALEMAVRRQETGAALFAAVRAPAGGGRRGRLTAFKTARSGLCRQRLSREQPLEQAAHRTDHVGAGHLPREAVASPRQFDARQEAQGEHQQAEQAPENVQRRQVADAPRPRTSPSGSGPCRPAAPPPGPGKARAMRHCTTTPSRARPLAVTWKGRPNGATSDLQHGGRQVERRQRLVDGRDDRQHLAVGQPVADDVAGDQPRAGAAGPFARRRPGRRRRPCTRRRSAPAAPAP